MAKKSIKIQKKAIIITILVIILGVASAAISYIYNYSKHYNNLFYPGVIVETIDLHGKNMDEAKKLINGRYIEKLYTRKIIVKAEENEFSIDFSKLEGKSNLDEVLNEAYLYGKKGNMFKRYMLISNPKEKTFKIPFTYNKEKLKAFIDKVEKQVNKDPINAKLVREVNGFSTLPEKYGFKLKKDDLEKDILDNIQNLIEKDLIIKANVEKIKPKVFSDKLKTIDSLISSYSTNYGGISSSARGNNIEISTNSINGTILMPGEVFSFNETVGERTAERGYKSATVLIGNKVDSGLGGGICQVSSTLYNAVLMANIIATERTHHTLPSSYVPLGRDATVDWGNIDYKFQNTLPYPIYIEGFASGGTLSFSIYSNSSLTNKRCEIYNDVYERIQSTTSKVEDSSLPLGQEEVEQNAYDGIKVRVYKKYYENGNFINTQEISNDFYRPVEGIIKVGTKK